jgi:plastocyanin
MRAFHLRCGMYSTFLRRLSMRSPAITVLALLASLTVAGCDNDDLDLAVIPIVNGTVSMLDQCDSTSFNAALGAGTCTGQGTMTLAQFTAELAANHTVAAWRFDPSALTMTVGGSITATNHGGEVHTFTRVAQFGGGIVPELNTASGNPTEAPECKDITDADRIAPGGTFRTGAATSAGTHYYQCCIHPWMRETATVMNP